MQNKYTYLLIGFLLFLGMGEGWSQTTFTGVGGQVTGNSSICFPLSINNGNVPLDGTNGVAGFCVTLTTSRIQNLGIYLNSPTGGYALGTCCGFGSGFFSGTLCFRDNGTAYFTGGAGGTFRPLLEIGNLNNGATGTGVWELCITNGGNQAATVTSWSVTLGGPNVATPVIEMNNSSCMVETCNRNIYDSGGPGFNYGNGELSTQTICPPVDGQCVQLNLTYDIESGYDFLDIYDGDSVAAGTYLTSFSGNGTGSVTSTQGCMTLVFDSDGIVSRPGFTGQVTCVPCAATVASNRPPNDDCLGAITLTGNSSNINATGCDVDGPNPHGTDTCSWMSTENSVFYTFEVTPSTPQPVEITLLNVSCTGGANQLQCALYDNDCSSIGVFGANFHGCASGLGTVTLESSTPILIPGTYLFVVDGNAGSECSWEVQSAVLEVEWMDFSARYMPEQEQVELTWVTANEVNNEGYWVQRTRDLQQWTSLDFVSPAPKTGELHKYRYTDVDQQEAGTVYYRLKQVDQDGKYHYSNLVNVEVGAVREPVVLETFPQPAQKDWNLRFALPEASEVTFDVFDLQGNKVYSQQLPDCKPGEHLMSVSMQDWAPGLYLYRIEFGGVGYNGKLIKNG